MNRFMLDWRCRYFVNPALETLTHPSKPFYLKGVRWVLSKLVDLNCSANNRISGFPDNEFFDGITIWISEAEIRAFHATFTLSLKNDPRYLVEIYVKNLSYNMYPLELYIRDAKFDQMDESDYGQYKVMLDTMEAQYIVSNMFSVLIDFIRSDHVAVPVLPHTYTLSKEKEKLDEQSLHHK